MIPKTFIFLALSLCYFHPFRRATVLGSSEFTSTQKTRDDNYNKEAQDQSSLNQLGDILAFEKENFLNDISVASLKYRSNDNDPSIRPSESDSSLFLLAVYEADCECAKDLLHQLKEASHLLGAYFDEFEREESDLSELSKPIIGKLNISKPTNGGDDNDDDILQQLFNAEETPRLVFMIVEHMSLEDLTESLINDDAHSGINFLEYVGKKDSSLDILDTVLNYWYRLIVTDFRESQTIRDLRSHELFEMEGFDNMDLIPTKPLFSFPTVEEMTLFIDENAPHMFVSSMQDFYGVSEREKQRILELMRLNDPFLAFVQCRIYNDGKSSPPDLSMYQDFDSLALHYLYRKDVAFFAVISDKCDWVQDKYFRGNSNGVVRILEIDPNDPSKHYWTPAFFDPSSETIFQPASSDEIMKFNMTQFAIVQSTPSILWFDQYTIAPIAFPTYREIHYILFIDVHTPSKEDKSTDRTFLESRLAITRLEETSRRHKLARPWDDVVFMIVPSSATPILTTFGINFWAEMDAACSDGKCFDDKIQSLPSAMITSRAKSPDYMEVFHLSNADIDVDCGDYVDDYYGNEECDVDADSDGTGGALYTFLNSYFEGDLSPTIKSEELPQEYIQQNHTLSSGVRIATTHTFHDFVMKDHEFSPHSIVYFYNPTCGFCKRFDTTWHNLARLVTKMKWNSLIDVVKVDISQNDLHIDGLNIKSVPAVYFFGKGRKDSPQKMLLEDDAEAERARGEIYSNLGSVKDPMVILKWVIHMLGKDDLVLLESLAQSE